MAWGLSLGCRLGGVTDPWWLVGSLRYLCRWRGLGAAAGGRAGRCAASSSQSGGAGGAVQQPRRKCGGRGHCGGRYGTCRSPCGRVHGAERHRNCRSVRLQLQQGRLRGAVCGEHAAVCADAGRHHEVGLWCTAVEVVSPLVIPRHRAACAEVLPAKVWFRAVCAPHLCPHNAGHLFAPAVSRGSGFSQCVWAVCICMSAYKYVWQTADSVCAHERPGAVWLDDNLTY